MFFKMVLLKISQISQENICLSLFLIKSQAPEGLQLFSKETPTHVFSYEIYEIFKNTFFYKTSLVTTFAYT